MRKVSLPILTLFLDLAWSNHALVWLVIVGLWCAVWGPLGFPPCCVPGCCTVLYLCSFSSQFFSVGRTSFGSFPPLASTCCFGLASSFQPGCRLVGLVLLQWLGSKVLLCGCCRGFAGFDLAGASVSYSCYGFFSRFGVLAAGCVMGVVGASGRLVLPSSMAVCVLGTLSLRGFPFRA